MEKPKTSRSLLQSLAFSFSFLAVFVLNAHAQSLPPAKFDGFVYGNHSQDLDTILIEAFFDPVCPDSRDSWPPLKKALDHYGPRVRLVIHLLPLPYHDNAYAASRALHIVDLVNPSDTFKLLEAFFEHQKQFYNAETRYLSRASVVDNIVKFGVEVLGNSYKNYLVTGFNDRDTDLLTRVSFKFSTSRGVYGTPFFFINGFLAPDRGSPINYTGWRNLIDPLIKNNKRSGWMAHLPKVYGLSFHVRTHSPRKSELIGLLKPEKDGGWDAYQFVYGRPKPTEALIDFGFD